MNKNLIKNIVLTFGSVILVAVLGSIFVNLGMEWFDSLVKPSQWIPDYVIPIVWTIIYVTAGIVLFLWANNEGIPNQIVVIFVINGVLNVLWCLVFFTLNQTFLGIVTILINFIFAVYLIMQIDKYRPIYSRALLIYPVWLLVATSLNLAVWILN